jgi:hypothetical protein
MVNHALGPGRPPGWPTLPSSSAPKAVAAGARTAGSRFVVPEGDYVVQHGTRASHCPGGLFRGVQIPAGDYGREVAFMSRFSDLHPRRVGRT